MNKITSRKLNFKIFKDIFKNSICFILLINSINLIGQELNIDSNSNNLSHKVISIGEKIYFGNIEDSASWTISNSSDNIFKNLKGNQINDFVFEKPGIYEVRFSEIKKFKSVECNHPLFEEKMIIEVSPVKMAFDFSQISFSERIQKGKNCNGIIISVPINVEMIKESPTKFTVPNVSVAGIGVDLIAEPIEKDVTIKNGVQILKYKLSGIVNNETYLMFDFVDYNNQIQTYNLLEIIK